MYEKTNTEVFPILKVDHKQIFDKNKFSNAYYRLSKISTQ